MPEIVYINKANGMHTRNYSFRMNTGKTSLRLDRSYIEIFANDIKMYTTDQYMFYS